MPKHIRLFLVWAHSHRIFTIFKSLGAPNDWLESVFKPLYQPITPDLFERDLSLFYDVANPKQANRPRFVLSGFQYCLREKTNDYLDEMSKELFLKEVFTEIGGKPGPHLSLIRDLSQATNALGSFLGETFVGVIKPIVGEELSNLFRQDNLKLLVIQAIDKLIENNNDFSSWSHLHAVLSGLPPYENIIDPLRSLFSHCQFAQLAEKHTMLGMIALQTASLQEPYLGDKNLHSILREEIVKVASVLAVKDLSAEETYQKQENDTDFEQHIQGLLLDSALNLSVASDQSAEDFGELIARMIDVYPSMIPVSRYMVERLYGELPINQAKTLSSLLVRLRAEKLTP